MSRRSRKRSIALLLASVWLVFTVSLVVWWIYFGISQVNRLISIEHSLAEDLVRYQKMLLWEGIAMIISIVFGAGAIFYYIYREMRASKRLQLFFTTLTHEIKTPLAGLKLKAEVLMEELKSNKDQQLVQKILGDVGRLNLQLENSLFLAQQGSAFVETVPLSSIIEDMRDIWSSLDVQYASDIVLKGDRRMLEVIVANIFQNATIHGHATELKVNDLLEGKVRAVEFCDNGVGFNGDRKILGRIFSRHYSGSGSGIGLYLIKTLARRMNIAVSFPETPKGFVVRLSVPV